MLSFHHSVRKGDTAESSLSGLVLTPGMACETASYDHFHLERLTFVADSDHRVRAGDFPVRDNVSGSVEELLGYLVEHLALERYALRKDDVEC